MHADGVKFPKLLYRKFSFVVLAKGDLPSVHEGAPQEAPEKQMLHILSVQFLPIQFYRSAGEANEKQQNPRNRKRPECDQKRHKYRVFGVRI